MNDLKFAINFVTSAKEAAEKDLKAVVEFEKSWSLCRDLLISLKDQEAEVNFFINSVKTVLQELKNDPVERLLNDSPNADDGDYRLLFNLEDHPVQDWDWTETINKLCPNTIETLNRSGVEVGWGDSGVYVSFSQN
jgi:hypothetical protein